MSHCSDTRSRAQPRLRKALRGSTLPRKPRKPQKGKIHSWYLTMGKYDAVLVSEFPDDEAAARFMLSTSALGNVTTQTLKAFTEAEYRKILASLP
jgi:uncharacterized protein with GYD domain